MMMPVDVAVQQNREEDDPEVAEEELEDVQGIRDLAQEGEGSQDQ